MNILAIGDVVGRPGRKILQVLLPKIKKEYNIDVCIANGENSATGNGITSKVMKELYSYGIDIITLGNHTYAKKEINDFIDKEDSMIRPANFPKDYAGKGSTVFYKGGIKVGIINLCGRVYFDRPEIKLECPFVTADEEIEKLKEYTNVILVDIHAEATSEKLAMGWYLDGRVSTVFGTHTHVQTADERILPNGTGIITDLGMTGPYNSVLGIETEVVINRFLGREPSKFKISEGDMQLNAVLFEIDNASGKCVRVERIRRYLEI